MKNIRRGLFLIESFDESIKPLIKQFLEITASRKSEITFAVVVSISKNNIFSVTSRRNIKKIERLILSEAEEKLDKFLSPFKNYPHQLHQRVLTGKVDEAILKVINEENFDILYKIPGNEFTGWDKTLGSTDLRLFRACPAPILMLRADAPVKRIIAAIDLQTSNEENDKLNQQILESAALFSLIFNAELNIIHVWSLYGETILSGGRGQVKDEKLEQILREEEESRSKKMQSLEKDFKALIGDNKVDYSFHLLKGNPIIIIPHIVNEQKGQLLIMGTVGRTGLSGFIMGNTAESIIHSVNCSILALKPEAYGKPVSLK
ncbi:MAG: universal stress protein [Bacteroidales bacterium]|nr:universal stress protein [Bacteroidales bacterium]